MSIERPQRPQRPDLFIASAPILLDYASKLDDYLDQLEKYVTQLEQPQPDNTQPVPTLGYHFDSLEEAEQLKESIRSEFSGGLKGMVSVSVSPGIRAGGNVHVNSPNDQIADMVRYFIKGCQVSNMQV